MNKNIDLTKILKDCPEGEQFWSPMLGYVKLYNINQVRKIVSVILETDATWDINANGTISIGNLTSPDIMLYPSKDQRDWSKFTAPWLKEERLPKTWEDFIEIMNLKYPSAGCFVEEIPKGLIDSYPTLNQIVAVLKLKKLRDYYNNNWHCDWNNEYKENAVITRSHGELIVRADWAITTFLTFKSIEIANEFLINFRELIEEAGDLI